MAEATTAVGVVESVIKEHVRANPHEIKILDQGPKQDAVEVCLWKEVSPVTRAMIATKLVQSSRVTLETIYPVDMGKEVRYGVVVVR